MASLLNMVQLGRLAGMQLPQARPMAARGMATAARAVTGKKELVATVINKSEHKLTAKQAEEVVNGLLEKIMETVANGEKVQVVGFGTFEPRTRAARKGRNPATGAELHIPESTVPVFSAGKTFKLRVKGEAAK